MNSKFALFAVGLILLSSSSGFANLKDDPLFRQTSHGDVKGYADHATKTWVWKSVPFAKPPVGPLRWKAPQPPTPWVGTRTATEDPSMCVQNETLSTWIMTPNTRGSEDCLYLNIYRPQTVEKNLPVYFWIHGGANYMGDADTYDLENLAKRANVVAVVVQYRLNAFGWFTHPALRQTSTTTESSGNFGTLDQIQALKWVGENIAAFGGNPSNITVAGESAGGHNTMAMLVSPFAKGLFHRAIMESGGMVSESVGTADQTSNRTIDTALIMDGIAEDMAQAKAVRLKMTDEQTEQFLRGLSAPDLLRAISGGPGNAAPPLGNLIEDGYVIPGNLLCTIESGRYNKVPIIAGANETEVGSTNTLLCSAEFQRETGQSCNILPDEAMPNYIDLLEVVQGKKKLGHVLPTATDKHLWKKANHYGGLFWRAAFVDELLRRMSKHQSDVYGYSFNWGEEDVRPGGIGFVYGAAHALEIPFFQGNADRPGINEFDWQVVAGFTDKNLPGRQALTTSIVSYIAQFVRTGNPNQAGSGLPKWQRWSNHVGGPKAIILDAGVMDANIKMDTTEVSMASVRYALETESQEVQTHTRLLSAPYATYEPGQYDYNVCSDARAM